jgi:hypothetical protein
MNAHLSASSLQLQIRDRMRSSVLLPAVLLLCSCAKTSEQAAAKQADSSAAVDSARASLASESTKKSTKGGALANDSTKVAASRKSTATSQAAATSAKAGAAGPVDTSCGIRGNPVLTDLGIGNVEIGRTVDNVKSTCRVIRDIDELTSEGTRDRVLTLVIGGDVYKATVTNGLVGRISVRTPRVATRDGLRVGTPFSKVAALKGGAKIAEGEDGVYLLPPSHCGLSFRFPIQSRWPTGRPWTLEELVRTHGNQPVQRILVTRCVHTG